MERSGIRGSERTATEVDWLSMELECKKPELIRTAHEQERKHSYEEAIKTWRQIQLLDPNDDSAARAIRSLEPPPRCIIPKIGGFSVANVPRPRAPLSQ